MRIAPSCRPTLAVLTSLPIRLSQHSVMGVSLKPTKPSLSSMSLAQLSTVFPDTQATVPSPSPSVRQLQLVALQAAIPMIGFGFIDNVVLIQAGEAIDLSLGVTLGLSTMAAAALGQCVSNIAGLSCGGIVDAGVARMRMPSHALNPEQLDMRITRVSQTMGSCFGVLLGGLLGMSCLLFTDTSKKERAKRERELHNALESTLREAKAAIECESAALFLFDELTGEPTQSITIGDTRVPNLRSNFHDSLSFLDIPLLDNGKEIGVMRLVNKVGNGSSVTFGENDEKVGRVIASQMSVFLRFFSSHE